MSLVLGLDVGTTKVAAVVVDAATGRQLTVVNALQPAPLPGPPGASETDPQGLLATAYTAARDAVAACGRVQEIVAIGVTGQQHGGLVVSTASDDALRPLTPLIGWQDQRASQPTATAPATTTWQQQRLAGLDTSGTGCPLASGFLATTLCWLAQRGELPTSNARATFAPDYIVAHLCQQLPCTDPTNAGGAGVYNAATHEWDQAMLDALDLPRDLLPPVQPTGSIVGHLAPAPAATLGLPAGLPVMNGLGDNQASFFGTVGTATDALLVNVGTGGQVSAIAPRFLRGELLETRPYLAGTYLLVGGGLVGGRSYALLRDFISQVGQSVFGLSLPSEMLYERLNTLAASVAAGSDGLHCDPRFGPNRYNPQQRGSITGLAAQTFTPGHLARALLEGVARTFHDLYRTMLACGVTPRTRLLGSGNGIRNNPLLVDILCTEFGLPLSSSTHREEAAHGAALLAAVATDALTLDAATALLRTA